ncbi:MAG: hypothetical protein FWD58_08630 [Firmicutes bacterium]|nr:hypothetical protein [Bacillota bacterium]
MNIYLHIEKLLSYAQSHLLLDDLDIIYARNLVLDEIKLTSFVQYEVNTDEIEALSSPDAVLNPVVDYAVENGAVKKSERAALGSRIMTILSKRPSEIVDIYEELKDRDPQKAEAWLADYMAKSNYAHYASVHAPCAFTAKDQKGKAVKAAALPADSVAEIEKLLAYGQAHLLLDELDVPQLRGFLIGELKITDVIPHEAEEGEIEEMTVPDAVLVPLLDLALLNKAVPESGRAAFADKVMSLLTLRPSEVNDMFYDLRQKSAQKAFEWLYDYAIKSGYINYSEIQKNRRWEAKGTKGRLEIAINRARPEKSNQDIEKAAFEKGERYPSCPLCKENEGYAGKGVSKKTLRTVPLTLCGEDWFWQYSPYSYFNQHGIAISAEHRPMKIDLGTFNRLLEFTDFMPSYFIGCNAALPRVGGSVLAHDHFQGGKGQMPLFKAPILKKLKSAEFPYIKIEMPDWYNSCLRVSYTTKKHLADFAEHIRAKWENYTDKEAGIIANSGGNKHNSMAVVARKMNDGNYVFDLILRNNRCDEEFPDGIFAAHPENRPVKSEAVGVIESLGLMVLPGRLDAQAEKIERFLTKETRYSAARLDPDLLTFADIIAKLVKEGGSSKLSAMEAHLNVKDELNRICEEILYDTAVFKKDEAGQNAFKEFLASAGIA